MATVRRTLIATTAEVVDENGNHVGEVRKDGRATAARLANIARREYGNPLITIRNICEDTVTYSMPETEFFKLATIVGTDEADPEKEGE